MKLPSLTTPVLVALLTACAGRMSQQEILSPPARIPAVDSVVLVIEAPPESVTDSGTSTSPAADPVSRSELTQLALGVFGDSVAPAAAVPDMADSAESTEPVMDVRSYETHARVEHYVRQFTGPAKDRIARRLEIGSRYEPMIRSKFRAAGIPEDMSYLALIESGYSPHAYSRAAAVGMWQFMTSTAKGMGMRVDWWVDERRDPARSTDGAIRFLRYLRDQFGSLYLAAAAYNGGPGRVSRGLTRFAEEMEGTTGEDRFFALAEENYLPAETKNYVPQLIAAALVGKDPGRYGMVVNRQAPYEYDSVRVGGSTPLAAVASATGVPVADIVELNTHVLRGVTPPRESFFVRIPAGSAVSFDSSFKSLDSLERRAFARVTSRKGESLASIANRHGITAKNLGWYNPRAARLKSGNLRPGQPILVPTRAVVAAALDVPDPSIERYGSAVRRKMHIVRRGETLSGIAKRYGTSVAAVKRLNGLRKTTIFAGQALIVKGTPKATRAKSTVRRSGSAARRPAKVGSAAKAKTKKP